MMTAGSGSTWLDQEISDRLCSLPDAFIPARIAGFEVTRSRILGDELVEKKGNYHNPTRQQGIGRRVAEQSKLNPSLTFRIAKTENSQLPKSASEVLHVKNISETPIR